MVQAIIDLGGDPVTSLASRFRFCTVAVSRNSSFAPLKPRNLSRGIAVGIAVTVVLSIWGPVSIHNFGLIVFHAVAASLMLSLLGLIGGIWSDKFDHIAAVTNFIITPLSFLSGTFYSIERLPQLAQTIAHLNPFFYMIDGFRYGFIGQSDAPVLTGMVVVGLMDVALWIVCWRMFDSGYKLKP